MYLHYLTERVLITTLGTCTAFTTFPAPCKTGKECSWMCYSCGASGRGMEVTCQGHSVSERQWREQNLSVPDFQSRVSCCSSVAPQGSFTGDWLVNKSQPVQLQWVYHHFKKGQPIRSPLVMPILVLGKPNISLILSSQNNVSAEDTLAQLHFALKQWKSEAIFIGVAFISFMRESTDLLRGKQDGYVFTQTDQTTFHSKRIQDWLKVSGVLIFFQQSHPGVHQKARS